jgi:hypothetical protein
LKAGAVSRTPYGAGARNRLIRMPSPPHTRLRDEEALAASLAQQRAAEIDAAYAAYDAHPLDEKDGGGLAAFRAAAGA